MNHKGGDQGIQNLYFFPIEKCTGKLSPVFNSLHESDIGNPTRTKLHIEGKRNCEPIVLQFAKSSRIEQFYISKHNILDQ